MKTILITGSTDGIGKLSAIQLAKEQHQIILHGRNGPKLEQSVAEVKALSNNENITGLLADFSDFSSIQKMITALTKAYATIDVLINNAGVFNSSNQQNQAGLDLRFAVNYFAPYILTNELLPLLKKSDAPRVINLSSAAQATVSIDALLGNSKLSTKEAYAQSKLAITMWTFAFAKANPSILSIAVNPGSLLNTKMVQEAFGQFWSPATKGSELLCALALSAEFEGMTGKYFDNDKGNPRGAFANAHADAYEPEKISQLMAATDQYLTV